MWGIAGRGIVGWVTAAPHIGRSASPAQPAESKPRSGWGSFLGPSTPPAPPASSGDVRVAVGNKLLMQESDVEVPANVDAYMRKMEVSFPLAALSGCAPHLFATSASRRP